MTCLGQVFVTSEETKGFVIACYFGLISYLEIYFNKCEKKSVFVSLYIV